MNQLGVPQYTIREARPGGQTAIPYFWAARPRATPSVTDTAGHRAPRRWRCRISAPLAAGAEIDGETAWAPLSARSTAGRGNICRLAVHPDYRRRGIARALVVEIEHWLREQGTRRVTALVEKEHDWATNFWTAVGYGYRPPHPPATCWDAMETSQNLNSWQVPSSCLDVPIQKMWPVLIGFMCRSSLVSSITR